MRCLIISDTTTHSKYWYYKYVQLLGGRKHTFAPHFSYWGGGAPPLLAPPPLSTPLHVGTCLIHNILQALPNVTKKVKSQFATFLGHNTTVCYDAVSV